LGLEPEKNDSVFRFREIQKRATIKVYSLQDMYLTQKGKCYNNYYILIFQIDQVLFQKKVDQKWKQ
jgi:hypothetical protein